AGMLTRAMAKQLSAALAHECLFVDFLFEEEPKKVSEALNENSNGTPNKLGPDLNGKAVNDTQYRGFNLKGYLDSDYTGCNMDRKALQDRGERLGEKELSKRVAFLLGGEAHQAVGGPTSLGATSEEGAYSQLNSGSNPSVLVYKTKSVEDKLKTTHTDSVANEESRADDISLKVKLEDLSNILKDTRSAFFTPDSLPYEPIIVSDESKEEEEVAKDKDTEATSHDPQKEELEQVKAKAKAELASMKAKASYLDINQLTDLLFKKKLKTLDSFPSLLYKVTDTLNMFATMVENASGATSMNVPSIGNTIASPAKGEKNTKDADINLKDELVDLLGKNVVTQYYTKKLLFDKYYDKMLKRKKSPKITNCEVLTKKGPITLKIYREDGSDEVILNLKVSNLHLAELREVIQACLDKSEKGQKTIYDMVKTRFDQLA
nr:hypothetical protein [Tanacetum cinerariifolium]